jgi:NAD(P)-dependent dehydrogenase (short-subunit alcohol dehydrogenase family)
MNPLDAFRLDGRAVVLTGASSGLGLGFARALAAAGADLVLAARRQNALEEIAAELRSNGTRVVTQPADVSSQEACVAVAQAAVDEFGQIDALINNAGIASATPALRESEDVFRQVLDVNLTANFLMAQACAPSMPEGSTIVNVASVLGHIGPRFPNAAYAASKHGVIGLTKDLAQEWSARKGIRVNALCPGYFASEMTADGQEAIEGMLATHSILPRLGTQPELDTALIFLVSGASSYITGQSLIVDGGLSVL